MIVLNIIDVCTFFVPFSFVLHVQDEPVRRILSLTESTLVERDPATYNVITLRSVRVQFNGRG